MADRARCFGFHFRIWFRGKIGNLAGSRMAGGENANLGDDEGRFQAGMVYQLGMSPASTGGGAGLRCQCGIWRRQ